MCTVVVRWQPGEPALVLALRDELTSRDFDDPGAWWPEQPSVIGGRDRTAGGSWCVTDLASGVTALVLNRPQRRQGVPSRGLLPLLAVRHGRDWPENLDYAAMASFALLLVTPEALLLWAFDGDRLTSEELGSGTHMVTSGGAEDGKARRYLDAFSARGSAAHWKDLVAGQRPHDDPTALVVRHAKDDLVFATVFGQLIEASPGALGLSHSRTPWIAGTWADQRWPTTR